MRTVAAWLTLFFGLGVPAVARAYEDQIGFGLGLGYAHAVSDAAPAHGGVAELSASVGAGQAWTVRGRAGYALHPADAPLHALHAAAELLYVVDVVEVVPYAGLGAGGVGLLRDAELRVEPAAHAVLGFDYLASRELAIELDVRAAVLPGALDTDPVYVAAVVGLVWLLDR